MGEAARAGRGALLARPEVRRAATVAAYVSVGTEPGTGALLDALARRRQAGDPARWCCPTSTWTGRTWRGPTSLAPARCGLLEPVGPRWASTRSRTADVVLVPGLAVSDDGARLGQGGGCYDRALARVPVGTPVCVLLHDDEAGVDVRPMPTTAPSPPRPPRRVASAALTQPGFGVVRDVSAGPETADFPTRSVTDYGEWRRWGAG